MMATLPAPVRSLAKQQGASLLVSLVLMTLLVVIGLSSFKLASFSQKLEANKEDSHLARIVAESALREAEQAISSDDAMMTSKLNSGVYKVTDSDTAKWQVTTTQNLWQEDGKTITYGKDVADIDKRLSTAPLYIIEELPEPEQFKEENSAVTGHGQQDRAEQYRITARGTGPSQTLDRYIQSNYVRIVTR